MTLIGGFGVLQIREAWLGTLFYGRQRLPRADCLQSTDVRIRRGPHNLGLPRQPKGHRLRAHVMRVRGEGSMGLGTAPESCLSAQIVLVCKRCLSLLSRAGGAPGFFSHERLTVGLGYVNDHNPARQAVHPPSCFIDDHEGYVRRTDGRCCLFFRVRCKELRGQLFTHWLPRTGTPPRCRSERRCPRAHRGRA